ncbi:SMP-30/gluconolactonase/LRE family protein [Rubinisphaera italica]|uniref:Gluconolactonase n=1 Tax=Rubinisphaera italica TaxID=2527969 RepID=A0A5C5XEN8_9PLAN|nr:SMP-30/gluconolactonase/LRE family protein [Rubinisphaera italica]TWT60585.1 Gluconolactonase precursor [Rubinisphaera italica]
MPILKLFSLPVVIVFFQVIGLLQTGAAAEPAFNLTLRSQVPTGPDGLRFHYVESDEVWKPSETAIIVCDVWDSHTCYNAVERLNEFVPRLEATLNAARQQGATIIHAPSGCMDAYGDHPARMRAINAKPADRLPAEITSWCYSIPAEEQSLYPLDQSDGGNDDSDQGRAKWQEQLAAEGRNPGRPWRKQSPLISIDAECDLISDRGDEIWNALEERGIKNVLLAGVHVNMCVLGRPFGLRQMAQNGKNVALMRDLTDAMYNPNRWPYVSHYSGNDLIISHIERFVCPTITSDQFVGGRSFRYRGDQRPNVVMVIAEDPYDTKTSLTNFAVNALGKDFRVTILHADEENRNSIPGLTAIESADVVLMSIRRRTLPPEQLNLIKQYLDAGKPLIALRSTSHAFALRSEDVPAGLKDWPEFDAEIIGGNYHGSYPDELLATTRIAESADQLELLKNVPREPYIQGGHMYKTGPLQPGAQLLLTGHVDGHEPEPAAWIYKRSDGGSTYYFALGHPKDFRQPGFIRLLANTVYMTTGLPVPEATPGSGRRNESSQRWIRIGVPTTETTLSEEDAAQGNSPSWFRCVIDLTGTSKQAQELTVSLENTNQQFDLFWNGTLISRRADGIGQRWTIRATEAEIKSTNLLVLRSNQSNTGLEMSPRLMVSGGQVIDLAGWWQLRVGEDDSWSSWPAEQFFGQQEITFKVEELLWNARILTRKGEFTPGIEGPACDAAGNLYAVNLQRQGTIGRVTPAGSASVFVEVPEGSIGNGIRFNADGDFYVADYQGHNILLVDVDTKQIRTFAHNPAMNQPNDLAITKDGTIFASDPNWNEGTGQIWRIDPDGSTLLVASQMGTTNGIEVSSDEKTLYVNESVQRNVWAFPINADRSLGEKQLVRQFADHGFDGMRADVDGNLYITRYGKGTVVKMSPSGEILQEIDVLGTQPSNICFGGPNGRTAYVTEVESTRVVHFRVDRPGRSWQLMQQKN